MPIHTIGDSHCYHGWPKYVITHHVGPMLCYSFGIRGIPINIIKEFNIKNDDTLIFCFGEIDCRCHIHKYITDDISYDKIIKDIVDNYIISIKNFVKICNVSLKNICIYNIVPPIHKEFISENSSFPFLGNDEERLEYTLYFNNLIKHMCIENNYIYFDVYDNYSNIDGFLNHELSDGIVHINNDLHINNFIKKYLL
jgi:hypothetical protein